MAEAVGYIFNGDARARISAAVKRVEGMPPSGDRPGKVGGAPESRRDFWAEIGANATLSDNQFKYAWAEKRRTATGWETFTGARSGTTTTGFALNAAEANNGATGIQGNGIDHDDADYPAGFELQPIRGEPVVRMHVDYLADGSACFTFEASNAEQGPCE